MPLTSEDWGRLGSRAYLNTYWEHLDKKDIIELWEDVRLRFIMWKERAKSWNYCEEQPLISYTSDGVPDCPMCKIFKSICIECPWTRLMGECIIGDSDPNHVYLTDVYRALLNAEDRDSKKDTLDILDEILRRVDQELLRLKEEEDSE